MSNLPFFLSILFLSIQAVSSQSRNCPAGSFFSTNTTQCELCPRGTFRSDRFFEPKTTCNLCRPGTFNPNFGLVSGDVCRLCYEDTFSGRGATKCKKCPSGTIANRGATACLSCGPGFAASPVNDRSVPPRNPTKCVPCRRGTYSDQPNNRVCKQCPNHMTSPKQATSIADCRPCPPGRESFPRSGGCLPCSVGDFKPGTTGRCRNCPPGSITSGEGAKSCKPCPRGTRSRLFQNKCAPCPPGTTTMGKGATFCRTVGFACPSGFFETKSGDCDRCRPGFRYNVEAKRCEKCPPDMISRGLLQKRCKKCPPGQQPDFDQRECICAEGEQFGEDGKCEKCPKGTFINNNYIGFDGCIKCALGTFADKRGSLSCTPCPRGTVASQEGSAKCVKCPAGLMPNVPLFDSSEEANGCVALNTGCPLGWVRQEIGATDGPIFGCRRISCRVGAPEEDIGKVCLPCDAGMVLNEKGTNCRRCPKDEVSAGGIITSCTKCKDGLRQDLDDPSKCSCLAYGWGIQDGICKPCPKGSFSSGSSEVCDKCAPGSFTGRVRSESCEPCPRNTIARQAGARKCRACPEGTVSNRVRRGTQCVGK